MSDIIQDLSDYINFSDREELDVPLFIERFFPQLLTNYSFSDFIYSTVPEEKKGNAILSAFKAKKEAEYNRPHKKGILPDYYALYCSFADPMYTLSRQEYFDYFSDFCGMPLSNHEKSLNPKVAKAIQTLTSIGESSSSILHFLDRLWDDSSSSFIPTSEITNEGSETDFDHIRKEKYADAKKLLMPIKNNILDAICAVMTDMNNNDIPLENIPVLQLFSCSVENNISITEPILIIEPSPFFIKKLRGNNPFRRRKVIYVLHNDLLVRLYTKVFKSSNYFFIHSSELSNSLISVDSYPTNVLIFGTHINNIELKTTYIRFCISCINSIHSLYLLDSDYYIQNKFSPIKNELSNTSINNIWLFPSGINYSTKPEMKVLLQCTYGYDNKMAKDILLTRYALFSNKKEQYIIPYYFQAKIPFEKYISDTVRLRSIYRLNSMEFQAKSDSNRNSAETFIYSSEISVHYTFSGIGNIEHPYRLSAYIREPRINSTKPAIIADSKISTKKVSPDEIEKWIETSYLASEKIRKVIALAYQNYYQNKPITLKSFILFNYEWEYSLPSNVSDNLNFINYSLLGDMFINKITYDDISSILYADNQYVHVRMILLSEIFDLAIKQGYCNYNPVKAELRSTQKDHELLYQVRSNLTLKNLNEHNFIKLYKLLLKRCLKGNNIALASITCLLTGLDANIVCALKWKDISMIHISNNIESTFYQLCIQRQLCNDGSEIKPFSRSEQYRKIPCPSILSDLFAQEYKNTTIQHSGMPQEYINDCYIFTSSKTINSPLSPLKMRKENRALIKQLNIPTEIIPIPDNSKGTIDTNLAYYPYDLFRTNFDYYARHIGKLELGEIEYILGIQPSTTFSRNYCDYSNDFAQLILFSKLERIYKKIFYKDNFHATKNHIQINEYSHIDSAADTHDLSFIGIDLAVTDDSLTSITIDAKYGFSINVQEMEVSNDN